MKIPLLTKFEFKLPKTSSLSEDSLIAMADVFLVYTMLSPIILSIIDFYIKLTPNFIRTFIVLEAPALISFFIYAMIYGNEVFKENKTIILIVLSIPFVIFLSSLNRLDISSTREGLKFFVSYCLFGFFLGNISKMSISRARRLFIIWMLFSAIFLLYSIYFFQDVAYSYKRFSLAAHNSARVGALNYFFALGALAYNITSKNVALKILSIVIFTLCLFFAYFSASRAALMAFLIAFILYIIHVNFSNHFRVKKLHYFTALIVIGVLVILVWFPIGKYRVKKRYLSILDFPKQTFAYLWNNDESAYRAVNRFPIWSDALSKFKQNPILGAGYGVTYYHKNPKKNHVHPHNILLQFLAETGIVGFSIFILFIMLVIKKAIRNYKLLGDNEDKLIYVFYPLSFTFFLIFSCSHFAIHENYFFWYFAGIIIGFDTKPHQIPFS